MKKHTNMLWISSDRESEFLETFNKKIINQGR